MSALPTRLQPPVDPVRDHVSGPPDAPATLLEYGDYQCRYCRAAHPGILRLRDERLPGRLRYVFRHFPNARLHPQARLAAEAAEAAAAQGRFWEMHEYLFAHQDALDREGLQRAAEELGLDTGRFARDLDAHVHAARVEADFASAQASGAHATPTFFINGRRYDGAWDEEAALEAIQKPLSVKIRALAQDFAGLSVSGGLTMLVFALFALLWANSPWREGYAALWETQLGFALGGRVLAMSLHDWVNDGLIVIFFFLVGLEIKGEVTLGALREPRQAALPIAAAIGGMLAPALIYSAFNAGGPAAAGWGIPISTDTAFALGLLAVLGSRVPLSLRVFVATAAIADDMSAVAIIALFYTQDIALPSLALAAGLLAIAYVLNRGRVYIAFPYVLIGLALWLAVLHSGVHTTLAGVLLAFAIPTRSLPKMRSLLGQSESIFRSLDAPAHDAGEEHRYQAGVRSLEAMVERLLSPAQRLARNLQPWSSYLVLPLFALASAGVVFDAQALNVLHPMSLGVILGLVLGKPLGITLGAWIAVRAGLARKPDEMAWRQIVGAGVLCGIGFTLSFFIATMAFEDAAMLAMAKLSVMLASLIAGVLGWGVLRISRPSNMAAGNGG